MKNNLENASQTQIEDKQSLADLSGELYHHYYKVVTIDMKSLGLRKNPTILTYKIGKWIKSPTVKTNKDDDGGIWVTRNLGNANTLKKYMKNKYDKDCKIFKVAIGEYLYGNSYRIKTDKVKFIMAV